MARTKKTTRKSTGRKPSRRVSIKHSCIHDAVDQDSEDLKLPSPTGSDINKFPAVDSEPVKADHADHEAVKMKNNTDEDEDAYLYPENYANYTHENLV
jgi:hypothetical protein